MSTDDVVDRDRPLLPEMELLRVAGGGTAVDAPVLETWQEVPVPGGEQPDLPAPYDGSD